MPYSPGKHQAHTKPNRDKQNIYIKKHTQKNNIRRSKVGCWTTTKACSTLPSKKPCNSH